MKRVRLVSASFLLLAVLASASRATEVLLPEFREFELANGMRILVAEDHRTPIVAIHVVLPYGRTCDPRGERGLAGFTAENCLGGIPGMGGTELWLELQRLGAGLSTNTSHDQTFFSMTALPSNWTAVLAILAAGLRTPTFPKDEITRKKGQWISSVRERMENPAALAYAHAYDLLYDGPLGEQATIDGIRAFGRKDLLRFHHEHYCPNRAVLIAVGDFDGGEAMEALRGAFDDWPKGPEPPPARTSQLRREGPRVRLVHKPGLTQATIHCAKPGLAFSDPDWHPLGVANTALGGWFGSRINMKLRAEGGKTYSSRSSNQGQVDQGQFIIGTYTRTAELGVAIDSIRSVVRGFVQEGLTEDEVEMGRRIRVGEYLLDSETPDQMTNALAWRLSTGSSLEEYRTEPSRWEAVTLEDANRAARAHFSLDEAVWVIVADKEKIGPALKDFRNIETVYYKEPIDPGNLLSRTRPGIGLAWNAAARGPRVSFLHRRIDLSGTYGLPKRGDPWEYNAAAQATIDLHRASSEYSGGSLYLGATGTWAGGARGASPHIGYRLFPYGLGGHWSLSAEVGWSLWGGEDLPGFYWSVGLDRFLL
ncbi:MAG: insulinase family protein [Candidatus Latescibacterota bacterium]|nr:MAG: insulinase family protein [Candidatus Latescibacterota bacterium]